jgi:hypothetical protein
MLQQRKMRSLAWLLHLYLYLSPTDAIRRCPALCCELGGDMSGVSSS